jgi:hypothetical protein
LRHPIDIVAMFAAIWLLASMVLDAVTPKELTAVMIAIAIGPAVIITAVFYYLRCPAVRARLHAGGADRNRAALAALPAPP